LPKTPDDQDASMTGASGRGKRETAGPGLGERPLRELRAERVLAIHDLARLAGVAPSTVFSIEARGRRPREAIARRIADALGVDPRSVRELRPAIPPGSDA
jgi:DNA-binding XRE family transcriptional regulator